MLLKKRSIRLIFRVTVLIFLIKAINSSDEYVKDLHKNCYRTKRPFFCVTFRIAKFVQNFDYQGPDGSAVKLVKIKPDLESSDLLPSPRFMRDDSEWDKFVKFLQRKLVSFLGSHGVAFEMPGGVQVVQGRSLDDTKKGLTDKSSELDYEDGRANKMKEKKIFILSIIILAKLVKIMLLVNMIFFALLFIKKIILITAIVFPSVLSHIKQACQKHHQVPVIAEEAPTHASSWFGWRQDNMEKSHWPYA